MSVSSQAASGASHDGQEHPIGLYFKVWGLLFVLSAMSYMVDYMALQGLLRWSLILLFMFLKAGLIIAVFMHFAWEPGTLKVALLLPTLAIVVFIIFIAIEADYIYLNRLEFLAGGK
jgi:cytochrome c oxidase subunit IV